MMEPEAALFADLGLLLYIGISLGWWAPRSTEALNASMGTCGRIEALFLFGAITAIPVWIWIAA